MIELAIELPLARFVLRADVRLGGRITAVMGPSGSGKTSLLEVIAGLRAGARGRIVLDEAALFDDARRIRVPPERRRVGYVPQDAGLFPHLTVAANVAFGARNAQARVSAVAETLGIASLLARYPATLSGGERQRVALARALASDPRLLLLDEPLAAVDVELRERILPWLLRVRDDWQVPMLYVTHNVGEALAIADQALLLRDGGVEALGTATSLLGSPSLASDTAAGIENLLPGRIAGHDVAGGVTRVALDAGVPLVVPLTSRAVGTTVMLSIRAEDVLVAVESIRGLSARNVLEATIVAIEDVARDVLLACEVSPGTPPWRARLTPAAVQSLGLGVGRRVWLAVKSHSVRLL